MAGTSLTELYKLIKPVIKSNGGRGASTVLNALGLFESLHKGVEVFNNVKDKESINGKKKEVESLKLDLAKRKLEKQLENVAPTNKCNVCPFMVKVDPIYESGLWDTIQINGVWVVYAS
jgi:hypothetical protein